MKEVKNVKRTVIKSVVGTLDLSIRYMLHGETVPGVSFWFPFAAFMCCLSNPVLWLT